MCVKLPPRDLNPSPCPPHSTSIYTLLGSKCLEQLANREHKLV